MTEAEIIKKLREALGPFMGGCDRAFIDMAAKAALAAVAPLIEAQALERASVPQLKRYGHEEPREFVLICSYCGDDTPGCTDKTPCADCLAMCNVFGEDGAYLRQLGDRPLSPSPAAQEDGR